MRYSSTLVLLFSLLSLICLIHGVSAETWSASWIGAAPQAAVEQTTDIHIRRAVYGASGQPDKQVDVTQKLQQAVASKKTALTANNALAGGDPAYGHVKHLEIDYSLDGKRQQRSIAENTTFSLDSNAKQALGKNAPAVGANQWIAFRKINPHPGGYRRQKANSYQLRDELVRLPWPKLFYQPDEAP
jgi:hypothetical protein